MIVNEEFAAARKAAGFYELNLNLFKASADREKAVQILKNNKIKVKDLNELFDGEPVDIETDALSFSSSDNLKGIMKKNNISITDCVTFREIVATDPDVLDEFLSECAKALLPHYIVEITSKHKKYLVISMLDEERLNQIEQELADRMKTKVIMSDVKEIRNMADRTGDTMCSVDIPQSEQEMLLKALRNEGVCSVFLPVGEEKVTAVMLNKDRGKVTDALVECAIEKSLTKTQDSVDKAMQKRFVIEECQNRCKGNDEFFIVFPYDDQFISVTKNGFEVVDGNNQVINQFSGKITNEHALQVLLGEINKRSFPVFTDASHLPSTVRERCLLAKSQAPKNRFTQSYLENLAARAIRDAMKANIAIANANTLFSERTINSLNAKGYEDAVVAIKELQSQNRNAVNTFTNRFLYNFSNMPQIDRYHVQHGLFKKNENIVATNRNFDYEKLRESHNEEQKRTAEELE